MKHNPFKPFEWRDLFSGASAIAMLLFDFALFVVMLVNTTGLSAIVTIAIVGVACSLLFLDLLFVAIGLTEKIDAYVIVMVGGITAACLFVVVLLKSILGGLAN